jgi:hypothetical protein
MLARIGVHFDGSVAGGHLHIDIDLDDFARLWRGDASQPGKTQTLQGAGERGNRAVGRSQTIGPPNAEARPPAGFVQLDEP